MATRASRALGAGCLALAGSWLAPVTAQAVDGAGRTRSATVRAVPPRQAKHQRITASSDRTETKKAPGAKPEPVEATESTGAVSTTWTAAEPAERACFKARRKLWQDGEGWLVKSVRVCP